MAKIGNYNFSINGSTQRFTVELHYNVKNSFFMAYIPAMLLSKLENLDSESRNTMSLTTIRVQGEAKHVFCAKSEETLKNTIYAGYKKLLELSATKRPVIILWYRDDARPSWGADNSANKEHPPISLYYSLTYATEERVDSGEPIYRTFNGSTFTLSSSRKATVIDDTPQSRAGLQHVYNALKVLRDKLKYYTENGDNVAELLQSNIKLLL